MNRLPSFAIKHRLISSNVHITFQYRLFSDKKEKIRGKTPIGKLDETKTAEQDSTSDVYAPFPDGQNPVTGEIGGPRGPEPTRYGDWERKGRVSDF